MSASGSFASGSGRPPLQQSPLCPESDGRPPECDRSRWATNGHSRSVFNHGIAKEKRERTVTCAPTGGLQSESSLPAFVELDHLLDLLLRRFEIEGSRVLHRRIVDRRQRQLLDRLLDQDEAPELTGEEIVHVAGGSSVE